MLFVLRNALNEINYNVHFFIENIDGISFYINNGTEFFHTIGDIVEYSTISKSCYLISRGFLMWRTLYVHWKLVKGELFFYLENTIKSNIVYATREIFDKQYNYKGSYAYIYEPGLLLGNNYVTRIICDRSDYYSIPSQFKEIFSPFHLFPVQINASNNIVLEEFKLCTNMKTFESYLVSHTYFEFLKDFRGLFIGIKTFKDNDFFHGDISASNIVIDEGVFKFIDNDLSFELKNIKQNNIFHEGVMHPTFPFPANLIMIRYIQQKRNIPITFTVKDSSSHKSHIHYYSGVYTLCRFDRLLVSNICADPEWEKIYNNFNIPDENIIFNVFHYTQLYQLCVAMLYYTNIYSRKINFTPYLDMISKFFDNCLNFKVHGFITIEKSLEILDDIILKLSDIIIVAHDKIKMVIDKIETQIISSETDQSQIVPSDVIEFSITPSQIDQKQVVSSETNENSIMTSETSGKSIISVENI